MDTAEIQKRLDAMPAAMSAKGKAKPAARVTLNGQAEPFVYVSWDRGAHEQPGGYGSDCRSQSFRAETIEDQLNAADAWIADLPSIEETKLAEFTALLASTIELGNANGIDVQFVNPLTEAMKRLSENALTYRVAA